MKAMEQSKLSIAVLLSWMCIAHVVQALPTVPALYAFGDSTADVGNNNYRSTYAKCNFAPYGRNLASGRATGRCSNGRLVIDFLAEDLGLDSYPSPYFAGRTEDIAGPGINFASSTHIIDYNGPHAGEDLGLADQITLFQQGTAPAISQHFRGSDSQTADHIRSSIFYISYGSDLWLQNLFVSQSPVTNGRLASSLLGDVSDALQALYSQGARWFIVMEMPAIGCMPFVMQVSNTDGGDCVTDINRSVKEEFNDNLERLLSRFVQDYSHARVFAARSFNTSRRASKHPHTYEFRGNRACCGTGEYNGEVPCDASNVCSNGDNYPWWDGIHGSERLQDVIEQELIRENPVYRAPRWTYDNLNEFFEGHHD